MTSAKKLKNENVRPHGKQRGTTQGGTEKKRKAPGNRRLTTIGPVRGGRSRPEREKDGGGEVNRVELRKRGKTN